MILKRLMLAVLVVLFSTGSAFAAGEASVFNFSTMAGEPAKLDKWVGKGKWTLVMFWAVDCPVCDRNKPAITEFHQRHKDGKAQVVGVSIDGMENVSRIKAKIDKDPLGFTNYVAELPLMAVNYQIAASESFRGTPTYWFFSPDGELKAVNPGPVRLEALEAYMERYANL